MLRRLRDIRTSKGMSQADLAEKTGLSEFTISQLETGKREKARPATMFKLARALDVEVKDLTDWRDKNLEIGVQELQHIAEVSRLLDEMLIGAEDLEPDELKRRIPHIRRAQRLLHTGIENATAHAIEMHRIETGDVEEEAPETLQRTAIA